MILNGTTDGELIAYVDSLAEAAPLAVEATQNQTAQQAQARVQTVTQAHEAFKSEVADSFFDALPEALHDSFDAAVNGKRAGEWVSNLLLVAPQVPAVQQAVLKMAHELVTPDARDLVPESSRGDFDTELGKASKDLKGVFHALYQSGFLAGSEAPPGLRPVRETGPGGLDMERWKSDRAFRRGMSKEDNQRYLDESRRLADERARSA